MKPPWYGDPVGDAAHRVLADAEPQVAAGLVRREVAAVLDVREVRLGEVGGAAEQLGQDVRERVDRLLARLAGRELLAAGLVPRQHVAPARRQFARRSAAGTRRASFGNASA